MQFQKYFDAYMRPIIPNNVGGYRQPEKSQMRILSSFSSALQSPLTPSISSSSHFLPQDEVFFVNEAEINKLANTLDKETGHYLAYHYTIPRIVSLMTHNNYLDQDLRKVGERAIDVVGRSSITIEFVRTCLFYMQSSITDELIVFVTIGLVEFYEELARLHHKELTDQLTWGDAFTFIVENIIGKELETDKIPTRFIPEKTAKRFTSVYQSKQFNDIAPIIIGQEFATARHFGLSKKKLDRFHHPYGIRCVKYSKDLHTIFTVDGLSNTIRLYRADSSCEETVQPRSDYHIVNNNILSIAWSEQESRLGACLQDYSLCFWDSSDNFTFEKTFSTSLDQLQTQIYYVEYCSTWISVDQDFNLHAWDLEDESCVDFPKGVHKQRVIDYAELHQIRQIALCSLDRKIVIWTAHDRKVLQIIEMEGVSAHQMRFSPFFRTLASIGFEKEVSIFTFDRLNECQLTKKLQGHQALLTALTFLTNIPTLLTADQKCWIRMWDLKTLNCVYAVFCGTQCPFEMLLNFDEFEFVAIGRRVFWYEFEEKLGSQSQDIEKDSSEPAQILFNQLHNQIVVGTKSHIRIIDAFSGKTLQILAGIFEEASGEIVKLELGFWQRSFVMLDSYGQLTIRRYEDAKEQATLVAHETEITALLVDLKHSLIVTASNDSVIQGFDGKKEPEIFRKVKHAHYASQVTLLSLSAFHNKLISVSSNSMIIVWNYEYLQAISAGMAARSEITSIQWIEPYGIFATSDAAGFISLWSTSGSVTNFCVLELLVTIYTGEDRIACYSTYQREACISTNSQSFLTLVPPKQPSLFLDTSANSSKQNKIQITLNNSRYSSFKVANQEEPEQQQPTETKEEHHTGLFATHLIYCEISKYDIEQARIQSSDPERILSLEDLENQREKGEANQQGSQNLPVLYFSLDNGLISGIPLKNIFKRTGTKPRGNETDYPGFSSRRKSMKQSNGLSMNELELREATILRPKFEYDTRTNFGHQIRWNSQCEEHLLQFRLFSMANKRFVTSGNGPIIRIWSIVGDKLCSINITTLLPYKWELQPDTTFQRKVKVRNALRVLREIDNRIELPKHRRGALIVSLPSKLKEKQYNPKLYMSRVKRSLDQSSGMVRTWEEREPDGGFTTSSRKHSIAAGPLQSISILHDGVCNVGSVQGERKQSTFGDYLERVKEEEKSFKKNPRFKTLKRMEANKYSSLIMKDQIPQTTKTKKNVYLNSTKVLHLDAQNPQKFQYEYEERKKLEELYRGVGSLSSMMDQMIAEVQKPVLPKREFAKELDKVLTRPRKMRKKGSRKSTMGDHESSQQVLRDMVNKRKKSKLVDQRGVSLPMITTQPKYARRSEASSPNLRKQAGVSRLSMMDLTPKPSSKDDWVDYYFLKKDQLALPEISSSKQVQGKPRIQKPESSIPDLKRGLKNRSCLLEQLNKERLAAKVKHSLRGTSTHNASVSTTLSIQRSEPSLRKGILPLSTLSPSKMC